MYGYKLWFGRKWSHDDNMKGGEFEELWIGWYLKRSIRQRYL